MMVPGVIFIVLSAILFFMAYLLYFKQAYRLISGINFSPRETVYERYDIPGLTRHLGRMCALIGLILLISGLGAFLNLEMVFLVPFGFIFIVVPVFLFGTERYMYVGKRAQRIANIVITAFMAAVAVFVIVTSMAGAKPPVIEIRNGNLEIQSMYGTEIPLDSIRQVDMLDLSGKTISKLNGFNLGNNLKGKFDVKGVGTVTLYQQGEPCNSVLIKTDDRTYLINLGSEAENIKLKSEIMGAMGRS